MTIEDITRKIGAHSHVTNDDGHIVWLDIDGHVVARRHVVATGSRLVARGLTISTRAPNRDAEFRVISSVLDTMPRPDRVAEYLERFVGRVNTEINADTWRIVYEESGMVVAEIRPCGISNAWQFFVLGFLVGSFRACGMGQAHAKAVGLLPRTQKEGE
jgi:hypothetical protein